MSDGVGSIFYILEALARLVRGPDMAIFTWQSLHCNFYMAATYMVYQYIALSLHSMITTKHILA